MQFGDPRQRRVLPDLNRWREFGALRNAAQSDAEDAGVLGLACIEWSRAFGAEDLGARVPTLRDLDVALGRAAEFELVDEGRHDRAKRCAAKDLAVRAMAHHHPRRIDLRREGDQAAVASAVNLHGTFAAKAIRVAAAVELRIDFSLPC